MKNSYTSEKSIQIIIQLLKQHNIREIIVSPGATNVSFVASVQDDPFFNIHSCVDERSAAYLACGIASENEMPVVLTCTGATASRNYVPGLTEAYYRKLPIIAITAAQHHGRIGQNIPQALDRSIQMKDLVRYSVQIDSVHTKEDEKACNLYVNEAILEATRDGGGPVHINMVTCFSEELDTHELETQRIIKRINYSGARPAIESAKTAIFVGAHRRFSEKLEKDIEEFCEKYNAVVLCDHTSNYYGKYGIVANIVTNQGTTDHLKDIDTLIHIGDISGAYIDIYPKSVWRVNPDGEIRDTFGTLKYVFEMDETHFFESYNGDKKNKVETKYYHDWKKKEEDLRNKLNKKEIPFSNIWVAKNTIGRLKDGDRVHLAILNTLRSWNFFNTDKRIYFQSNTGGFGIDGIVSTALGQSLATNETVYCFVGDLAFFYDLNSICNRGLKNNLRILLINNGCGTEFHNYSHGAARIAKEYNKTLDYIAADGHNGNKSKTLVKHYAEDLGCDYLSANNKDEFLKNIEKFTKQKNDKAIIFEVFTDEKDENIALKTINELEMSSKTIAKKALGQKGKRIIKKIVKKTLGK